MSKKQKPSKVTNEAMTILIVVRKIQFTFLEDSILKIIEKYGHASDKKIAAILCLKSEDISLIIDGNWENGEGLKKRLEGDHSRRTLKNGWEKKEMAIVKEKNKNEYQFFQFKEKNNKESILNLLKNLDQLQNNKKEEFQDKTSYCDFYQEYLQEFAKLKQLIPDHFPARLKKERSETIYEYIY